MFTVSLTIPDLDMGDAREAAKAFLSAIASGDWSCGGMVFEVTEHENMSTARVALSADEITAALNWKEGSHNG